MSGFTEILKTVITKGLCTNCGTCIGICPLRAIEFDHESEQPVLTGKCTECGMCPEVCPGKDIPLKSLSEKVFGQAEYDENLGYVKNYVKGYAAHPLIRKQGTSGGIVSALLTYAIENGIVENVLTTGQETDKPWRGKGHLVSSPEEILQCAGSKYVVVPTNEALDWKKCVGHNFGVVGVPCQVHGIRKAQLSSKASKITSNLKFVIGIFCGTNWSPKAVEHFLIEHCPNINSSEEVSKVAYRGGPEGNDIEITTLKGENPLISARLRSKLYFSRRDRCCMCYDFSGELADISVGDIYTYEGQGQQRIPQWSAVLVRSQTGLELLQGAEKAGYIQTEPLEKHVFLGNIGREVKKHVVAMLLQSRVNCDYPTPNYECEFNPQPIKLRPY